MTRPLSDLPLRPTIHDHRTVWHGYRRLDAIDTEVPGRGGRGPTRHVYEVVRIGEIAAVLPYDPVTDRLVIIRQFRAGAHLAHGLAENLEIIAGRVEPGEDIEAAVRREAMEEAGIELFDLKPFLDYVPLPAATDEHVNLYIARCDATRLPTVAGELSEQETIEPMAVSAEDLLAADRAGRVKNGHLLLALSWFVLHRASMFTE